jgi:hypothetical protein
VALSAPALESTVAACQKARFTTGKYARNDARRLRRAGDKGLHAYLCPCGYWHIGHRTGTRPDAARRERISARFRVGA